VLASNRDGKLWVNPDSDADARRGLARGSAARVIV
jgi:hypothetical protein